MIESRAKRSALGAAPDIAVVDFSLNLSRTRYVLLHVQTLLNHTSKQTNDPSTCIYYIVYNTIATSVFAQEACVDLHKRDLFLRPDHNLKLGIGFA